MFLLQDLGNLPFSASTWQVLDKSQYLNYLIILDFTFQVRTKYLTSVQSTCEVYIDLTVHSILSTRDVWRALCSEKTIDRSAR